MRQGVPLVSPFLNLALIERRSDNMAMYHCSIKNISRSGGKSAVASASYRAGEKLEDLETGLTHDYTKKTEVVYSEIFLCENAPREYQDRATLWNAVEQKETASNSRLAREWEVALPNELTLEQSKKLVRGFAQSLADEGMCVDTNIHWKDGNHHAHIMGTVRAINEKGEWTAKTRKVYDLDENGQKIPQIDKKTGLQKVDGQNRKQWKSHKEDYTNWNSKEKVEEWRERWADQCNKALEKAQSLERVDHRSFERQGIERIPTIHEGYVARQMEEKGQTAERCEINRDINAANTQLSALEHQQNLFTRLLEQLREKVKEALNERLQRLRTARATDEPVGRNADGNKPVQENDSRPAGGSVAERLANLRSSRAGGEVQQGTGRNTVRVDEHEKEVFTRSVELGKSEQETGINGTVGELLASARAGIDSATAKEEDSRASRNDREAERERLNRERERQAKEAEQRLAKERAERKARSRSYGLER